MMDERKKQDLYNAYECVDTILFKKYISKLDEFEVVPPSELIMNIQIGDNLDLYHFDKIVYDKKENIHDKLMTVYASLLADEKSSLVMILRGTEDGVDLYLGAVCRRVNPAGLVEDKALFNLGETLSNVVQGNFPGTVLRPVGTKEKVVHDCFEGVNTIAMVSGVAALRNQQASKSEEFVQGMEKLVDSMRGKEYTAIYIADVMSHHDIESLCAEYEDIYTQLAPFKQTVHTLNENSSTTDTTSLVEGIVNSTNESISKAITHGTTQNTTKTDSFGGGLNLGFSKGAGSNRGLNGFISRIANVSAGMSVDYHHSVGRNAGVNDSESNSETTGTSQSITKQSSVANAVTAGKGESLQITYDNRAVKTLLDRIDEQIKRLRACEDFGMFDSCVYFLAEKYENAVAAASTYKSLMQGENSSMEPSVINVWTNLKKGREKIEIITNYLKRFYHPLFQLELADESVNYFKVSPALMVSGRELAFQFTLPKKAVVGLPVIECAEFGRNVMSVNGSYSGDLEIGNVYHMHHEENGKVCLSLNDLTAHTFVTGSTGSGKSNAIYQMLSTLVKEKNKTFMVVEPAKGEYKDVFGTDAEMQVEVYGTNPKLTKLLRINPFRFAPTTHIYEHMDRLIEIFNVCWPMYAAMPAVLKAALEQAYISAGWDLEKSENITGVSIYPTFSSVAREVKKYLESSEYSDENKGNYKGALLTRLESLTNGINGMIFCADDLNDEDLFDKNVVIDLSRVGSTETKALIMGILIMKLQEYRAGTSVKNSVLKHVTVLEEAHNLLKRTSADQGSEGGNLLGKSVEMLANSIAEMRTYGEAFIIADQAPGLLDMSVIRNTNTKIVLRLPDYSDRELVGRAANLNDEQIAELAKLKTGVAAVYQNNWIAPVLCQFRRYDGKEEVYIKQDSYVRKDVVTNEVLNIIMKSDVRKQLDNVDYKENLIKSVSVSKLPDFLKVGIIKFLERKSDIPRAQQLAKIAYEFFETEETLKALPEVKDIIDWEHQMVQKLQPSVRNFSDKEISVLLAMLVKEHYTEHRESASLYMSYMEYLAKDKKLV